ncbi:MAG: hypothetical protein AAGI38_12800 [Bacteroidota bacterium]
MPQLDKTDAIRQKEARIAELEKQITSRRRVIKSLRTILAKLQDSIKEMERTTVSRMSSFAEQIMSLQQELKDLMKQALAHKKIFKDKELREGAEEMYESLAENDELMDMLREQQEESAEFNPEDFAGEDGKARTHDPFAEFRPEVPEEDKRSLRKVYLRLSRAFHPDRARTPEEAERNHNMMQQITAAYQQHDVETLLRMERQYLEEEFDPETAEVNELPSLLDSQIARLEQELDFLTQQKERLSEEIKNTRKSDMGQALTDYDRGNRYGYGFEAQAQQMEEEMQGMIQIRDELKRAVETGKMTPELREMFEPVEEDDIFEGLFGPDGPPPEIQELADMVFGSGPAPVKTRFETGDFVSFSLDDDFKSNAIGKTAYGMVANVRIDRMFNEVGYGILPEVSAIEKLSNPTVLSWLEHPEPIPLTWIYDEEYLKKAPKKVRKSFDEVASIALTRRVLYAALFKTEPKTFPPDRAKRLSDILLSQPQLNDGECWINFLRNNRWPQNIRAKVMANPYQTAHRKKVLIQGVNEYDASDGLIMRYEYRNNVALIPLHYLKFDSGSLPPTWKAWVEDYLQWAQWRLPGFDV